MEACVVVCNRRRKPPQKRKGRVLFIDALHARSRASGRQSFLQAQSISNASRRRTKPLPMWRVLRG
ncbi:MAG: hypothetical protein V5B33_00085 [Candidatus Accumulibacter sp. UW20]